MTDRKRYVLQYNNTNADEWQDCYLGMFPDLEGARMELRNRRRISGVYTRYRIKEQTLIDKVLDY